ncbi:hypothetical protein [Pseudomonas indica]|jgi:hypothetical protein|uniref:Uncharacterized protein n=1 Tax=Pseudomonas indica TaxID=137658 RepID=A0A1G8UYW0_9PSED|nr:hypothetical protein [Pseudomonas indica]MBU3057686.1 hypothetical protein [Pseudomonas indica]PAU57962.1 hypothetical protein BZL42_13380 [Pseudomonas indica]SDJ58767.1 hypothetical protein SAMN05216186_10235 [Pseudomonas indica]
MRIDGFTSSYPLDRSPRPGSAVTPYRESQREIEERREQPTPTSASQGFEQTPQLRRVQPGSASGESLPVPVNEPTDRSAMTSRAAQALASYSTTASFASDVDAPEVLGLDLYA